MKRLIYFLVFSMLCIAPIVAAQADCPALVDAALAVTSESCGSLGRNQACYGNFSLNATAREDVPEFVFEQAGDMVNVADINTLDLSSMSLTEETWGVALLLLQANLPDTLPGQNVTMVLFGDVDTTNVVDAITDLPMMANGNVNVRLRPRTDQNNIIASLTRNQEVVATGRLADNSWIRIVVEGDARGAGWVSADFLTTEGDINSLSVVESDEPIFGPMQAFYFSSSIGDSQCAEAPDSGILIQTPQGAGTVNLRVNEVDIQFGSTVYMQAGDGFMTLSVLEGSITVTAQGVTQAVPAGTFTRIPLDGDGLANGSPEFPQPYDDSGYAALPLMILPTQIVIAPPVAPEAIESVVQEAQAEASGDFFPTEGVYDLHWTYAGGETFNQMQLTVITPGESFSMLIFGGNPNPIVFNRIDVATYQGSRYFFTFDSATSFTGTITDAIGFTSNVVGTLAE